MTAFELVKNTKEQQTINHKFNKG